MKKYSLETICRAVGNEVPFHSFLASAMRCCQIWITTWPTGSELIHTAIIIVKNGWQSLMWVKKNHQSMSFQQNIRCILGGEGYWILQDSVPLIIFNELFSKLCKLKETNYNANTFCPVEKILILLSLEEDSIASISKSILALLIACVCLCFFTLFFKLPEITNFFIS